MNDLTQALAVYQRYDPAGWVDVYRYIPVWGGCLLVVAGVALLAFGGGRALRWIAGPMGAAAGFLWAPVVIERLQLELPRTAVSLCAALGLSITGLWYAPAGLFAAVGLPAGVVAGQLAGSADWMLGFIPGLLLVGFAGAVFSRLVGAVAASVLGAWMLCIGILSSLHLFQGVAALAATPGGVILAAVVFATAGGVYQMAFQPSQEQAARLAAERKQQRDRLAEKQALEERWAHYTHRK